MLRAEFPLMLSGSKTYVKDGKTTQVYTVVSLDSGDSMRLYSDKELSLKLWEKYLFDISINGSSGKTYFNLNGARPLVK